MTAPDASAATMNQTRQQPLRLGVAGLDRAFTLMLPTFLQDPRIALVVACDPPQAARAQFSRDFGAPVYDEVEQLAADPRVEAIYIASPHQFQAHPHRRGAWQACAAGKTDGGEIGPARAGWW